MYTNKPGHGVAVEQPAGAAADPLWTVVEVARYLRLEPETVRTLARAGRIPAVKVGRVWRFKKELIEAYLMK